MVGANLREAERYPTAPYGGWTVLCACAFFVFIISLGFRAANIEHEPITDELYHLLAGDSWVRTGSLSIAEGEYTRASMYSKFVGVLHGITDGDVNSIRFVGALIGAILVVLVFLWSARTSGLLSGAIAATLLALMPGAIFLSQHIRFYNLHALIFFVIAAGAYALVTDAMSIRRKAVIGAGLVLLSLLATHLQITTLVGLAGIGLWIFFYNIAWIVAWVRQGGRALWIALALIAAAIALAIFGRSFVADLLGVYLFTALWNSGDSPLYYHYFYSQQFGALWSLMPVAVLTSILVRPRPALFCASIFLFSLMVQSFGGMRAERFLFYAMPFFFIIWGIAGAAVYELFRNQIRSFLSGFDFLGERTWILRFSPPVIMICAASFLLLSTPFLKMSVRMAMGQTSATNGGAAYWDRYATDWRAASSRLKILHAENDVTIVSQELQALYFVGDYDYNLSATTLADVMSYGNESNIDPRTGRPAFADAKSLLAIIDCNDSGVIVIHNPAWRNRTRVTNAVADAIELNTTQLEVPGDWGLMLFQWQSPAGGVGCPAKL